MALSQLLQVNFLSSGPILYASGIFQYKQKPNLGQVTRPSLDSAIAMPQQEKPLSVKTQNPACVREGLTEDGR